MQSRRPKVQSEPDPLRTPEARPPVPLEPARRDVLEPLLRLRLEPPRRVFVLHNTNRMT